MTPKARRRDEAAFLAGACCALQAVFGKPTDAAMTDYIPPAWLLAPMCGRLLADLKKRNEEN
jgi:4-amino-4-deoxy-L-arabinose transferase-like glycosyltransferase